jgi:hypothetical protein
MLATWYPFTCTIGTEFLVVYQENSKLEDENWIVFYKSGYMSPNCKAMFGTSWNYDKDLSKTYIMLRKY